MQYSLLSKFEGVLLGAALGDLMGSQFKQQVEPNKRTDKLLINQPNLYQSELEKRRSYKWGEITVSCAKSLITKQGFNQEDWQEICRKWQQKWHDQTNRSLESRKIKSTTGELEKLEEMLKNKSPNFREENGDSKKDDVFSPTPSNAVIPSLPVALLYHEDEFKLQQKLQQWGEVWGNHLEINPGNLAIGYAMAQALTEKLDPLTLIPKIIDYIGKEKALVGQLRQVETLVKDGANLETAITQLSRNAKSLEKQQLSGRDKQISHSSAFLIPIALALYCFLSTPEDFGLGVLRAARTRWVAQTCSIVGALSGAYNSSAGIPVGWRQTMGVELLGTVNEVETMRLAKSLWAVWCGVYNPEKMRPYPTPAVAATNVIRPHPRRTGGD